MHSHIIEKLVYIIKSLDVVGSFSFVKFGSLKKTTYWKEKFKFLTLV